jgi:hypothetical protein
MIMEKLPVFKQVTETIKYFDNGGRFYDLQSTPDDGVITSGEIGKVAGVFSSIQKKVLFVSLAISGLPGQEKNQFLSALSGNMQAAYNKYIPQELMPSEAVNKGVISSNAIITGIPKMIESKTEHAGFVFIPISTGKAMSMMLVPIFEKYDVYELRDDMSATTFLIAHAKGDLKLPEKKIKAAGVLKELKKQPTGGASEIFLEALYYCDAD